MWIVKAPDNIEQASGEIFGHTMSDGYVLLEKQYWYQFFLRRGFKDVTPSEWRGAAKLPLNRILIVHRAAIGDMMFATPVISYYKNKFLQGCEISFFGGDDNIKKDILLNNPKISRHFTCQEHNIGVLVDEFDEVIDFGGAITNNVDATYKNAYDIYFEFAGLEPVKRPLPELFVTDEDAESFRVKAKNLGLKIGEESYIVINVESSTPIRNWPLSKFKELSYKLSERYKDHKIVLLGLTMGFENIRYITCKKCQSEIVVTVGSKFNKELKEIKCEKCSRKIVLTTKEATKTKNKEQTVCIKENENIIYLMNKINLREMMCLIKRSAAVIGVDSAALHIGAAFERACFGIFAPFVAELRMKYFLKSAWVQKTYPCAPCFLHHINCPRLQADGKTGSPYCMQSIMVDEVFDGFVKLFEKNQCVKPKDIFDISIIRCCPVCGAQQNKFVYRKGKYMYCICEECHCLFTHILPNKEEIKDSYNDQRYFKCYMNEGTKNINEEMARVINRDLGHAYKFKGKILDVGSALGSFCNELNRLGWDVQGIEISKYACKESQKKYKKIPFHNLDIEELANKTDEQLIDIFGHKQFDVIYMNNTIEHLHYPVDTFKKLINRLLSPSGVVVIIAPCLDLNKDGDKWMHINTFFAGEHTFIMGKKAMDIFCHQIGLNIVKYDHMNEISNFLAVLKRTN